MGSGMTDNKRAKRDARERQRKTGERYVAARRRSAQHERYFEADCCANCLERLPDDVEGLFCSELCMQTCDTVRYWRRVVRDGRYERPDVREAVGTRVAFLLAGGYGKAARRLSRDIRNQVWARDGAVCRQCGKPGEEIDHIEGDSPDPDNLQLLCKDCHRAKTNERMRPATGEQKKLIAALVATRVEPEVPALLADDEVRWKAEWSSLKKARRERLLDEMRAVGLDLANYLGASRAELIDALCDELEYDDYEARGIDDDSGFGPDSYFAHAMAKGD